MQRIFYFSGYRLKVFEWDGRELLGTFEFEPDKNGFEAFERFLESAIAVPVKLLVDMIEEDFRREAIPHVNRWDRKVLVQRLIDRHYREEDSVYSAVVGRSRLGRRDDQLLLSALTNSEVLRPWLDRMEAREIMLAGIWSLPLITKSLPRKLVIGREKNSLVVSRQTRGALRNTFFRFGKLMLSRQARFDKSVWEHDTVEALVTHLQRGANEIFQFLNNQRIMEADQYLHVNCLLPAAIAAEARALLPDSGEFKYHFIELESIFKHYKLKGMEDQGADTLFSYLCSRELIIRDHYASSAQKSVFNHYLVDRVVTQIGEVGALLFVTAAVLLALNGMEMGREVKRLDRETSVIAAEYEQIYGGIERELQSAETVRESVGLVAALLGETAQSPRAFFAALSEVLGDSQFAAVQLDHLEWEKHSAFGMQQLLQGYREGAIEETNPYQQNYDAGYAYSQAEEEPDDWGLQPTLRLRGRINIAGLSYAGTVERVQRMIEQFRQLSGVVDVLLIKTPVDLRASSNFSDLVGKQRATSTPAPDENLFELLIVLRGVDRA